MWASLVLDFTRHFKIYELDVIETAATSPLFNNKAINRTSRGRKSGFFAVEGV